MPELSLDSAEIALQVVNKRAGKAAENILGPRWNANSDAAETRWPMKESNDCKRIMGDNRDKKRAEKSFTKKAGNGGSESSVYGELLHKKDFLGVLP